jgi:hypothetical protein
MAGASEIRVLYDVSGEAAEVLAIVAKSEAAAWRERRGEQENASVEEQGEAKA